MDTLFPDIPRFLSALAESLACLVIIYGSKKYHRFWPLILVACSIVQIILQLWVASWPLSTWFIGILINITWMYVTIHLCTSLSKVKLFYTTMKAFVFAEFIASFAWFLSLSIFWHQAQKINLMIINVSIIIYLILTIIYLYINRNLNLDLNNTINKRDLKITFFTTLIIFSMSNIGFLLSQTSYQLGDTKTIFIFRTMVDILGLAILYIQDTQRKADILKDEIHAFNHTMYYQHRQYEQYRLNNQQIDQKIHDLKYQLELLVNQDYNKLIKDQIIIDIKKIVQGHDALVNTSNPILDVVLSQKNQVCLSNDISFSCMADGRDLEHIDTLDLYSLLGNALDNAIESCLNLEINQRLINLRIYQKNNFIIISLENPYQGLIDVVEGLPQTTKENQAYHGFGIKSMQMIVEKYHGNLSFAIDDNWFKLNIMLPK